MTVQKSFPTKCPAFSIKFQSSGFSIGWDFSHFQSAKFTEWVDFFTGDIRAY